MLSYADALQLVLDNSVPLAPATVFLPEAAGLVLAVQAYACRDMPPCDNAAMDGYALAELAEGAPLSCAIVGAAYAGHPFAGELAAGTAVRTTTGAPLPDGTVTVVPLEDATERDGRVLLQERPVRGEHIRRRGEEFCQGELLVAAGDRLRAGEISLLASAGFERVTVHPRPRVAIISTGDELVALGTLPGPGQIVNSNLYFLMARLRECGCDPIAAGIGRDDPAALDRLIAEAMRADLVLTTGGISVGERDLVQAALAAHNFQRLFWKVAIKPGKPVLFGRLQEKPFFGLPGNPAATAATFELFVVPALRRLAGHGDSRPQRRSARLTTEVSAAGARQTFLWCRIDWCADHYKVTVYHRQGSGQSRSLQGANALLPVPAGTVFRQGEDVEVLLLEDG